MISRLLQLTRILHFLTFHVKQVAYTAYKRLHKSIHKLHLLVGFFLLGFFVCNLSSIEALAKEDKVLSNVTLNGISMNESSGGVYTSTLGASDSLSFQFYSDFEKLTDYNLKVNISFSYPQTTQSFLNITPFYRRTSGEFVYLAQIGKIYSNGNSLVYRTKKYYDDNQSSVPPFTHGGYSTIFGGSYTIANIDTDLTYYFGENDNVANIGLYFETGTPGILTKFPSAQRTVTVSIEYFDAVEKATIENAETTKNIFEWLQDGFVDLIVPTSEGIDEMLDETSSTLETRLGILYLPIRFAGELLGVLTATLEGAVSGQSITVPQWNMSLFGHDYIMWHQTTFSMTDNAIFHYIVFDLGFIFLVRIGYLLAMFTSIILTINTCSDNMIDEEFAHFMTAEEKSNIQYIDHYHLKYDDIDWGDDD